MMGSCNRDEWFHGKASCSQVEELVKKAGADGSFAVRTSESVPGGYTISLLCSGHVYTYRVIPTGRKYAIETNNGVQKRKFASVDEMVAEYRKVSNGLVRGLTNPVKKPLALYQQIRPDILNHRSATVTAQSALTMPLPPIPQAFSSSTEPETVPPVYQVNSHDRSPGFQSANSWFHGNASLMDVIELVKKAKVNGSFAVRVSETVSGACTLSVLYKGKVYTYRILPTPCGRLAVQTEEGVYCKKYKTVNELVHDYRKSKNGIVCALTNPVGLLQDDMSPYAIAR